MKITNQQLIGLSVETESGEHLGQLEDFTIDIDSQSILEYKIKPSSLVEGLIKGELIISRGQIVSITADKIIVEDNITSLKLLVKQGSKKLKKQSSVALNKQEQ